MRDWPSSDVSMTLMLPTIAPIVTETTGNHRSPASRTAWLIAESGKTLLKGTTPAVTPAMTTNRSPPMMSEPTMAMGTSRCGLCDSSEATVTVSKPMYAKKTSAALATTLWKPSGAGPVKLPGWTNPRQTTMKMMNEATWTTTKIELVVADSLMPTASSALTTRTETAAMTSYCE